MEPGFGLWSPTPMNMQINSFNNTPVEQVNAPRAQAQKPAMRQGAHAARGSEHVELTSTDSVNNQAGVRTGLRHTPRSLSQRRTVPVRTQGQRYTSLRRSRGGKTDKTDEVDDDSTFLAPVNDTLDTLSEDSSQDAQEELEAQLERYFEPLQRYNIYYEALLQLELQEMAFKKKNALRRALNSLMSVLMERHSHEVRKALQASDDMLATIDAMGDDAPTSVRDLRFLIGAKSKGSIDTPLSPLTMLKALIKNFGSDKCVHAMSTLRSRMMSGF